MIQSLTGSHNHRPDHTMGSHPSARLLDPESLKLIESASKAGIAPIRIKLLLENRGEKVLLHDIYNYRFTLNLSARYNRTPVQMVLQKVEDEKWSFKFSTDPRGHLTHLFLIHPLSLRRLKQHPSILLIDATYKVNKYRMPLVHTCGVTATGQTFDVGFCFMKSETTADYSWFALEMRRVYDQIAEAPLLLVTDNDRALINALSTPDTFDTIRRVQCLWHLEQNVKVQLSSYMKLHRLLPTSEADIIREKRKMFLKSFWTIVKANTELSYNRAVARLEAEFSAFHPEMVNYFWKCLHPNREYWAVHRTHQHLVFGVTVTSRVESSHARLKRYVKRGNCGLYTTVDRIGVMVQTSEIALDAMIAKARSTHTFQQRREPAFGPGLLTAVSSDALSLVLKQLQYARSHDNYTPECSTLFSRSMGIPCAHFLKAKLQRDPAWKLSLSDFHFRWYYEPDPEIESSWNRYGGILEPVTLSSRSKRLKRQDTSTRRNQTLAEIREHEDHMILRSIHSSSNIAPAPSLQSSFSRNHAGRQICPTSSFDSHGNLLHTFQM